MKNVHLVGWRAAPLWVQRNTGRWTPSAHIPITHLALRGGGGSVGHIDVLGLLFAAHYYCFGVGTAAKNEEQAASGGGGGGDRRSAARRGIITCLPSLPYVQPKGRALGGQPSKVPGST